MDLSTVYKKPKTPRKRKMESEPGFAPSDGLLLCQKDKLAIVASAEPTRGMAPFDNKDYELWGLSVTSTYPDVTRLDLLFEMHPEDYYERDPNVLKRLQELKQPLYMLKQRDDIPMSMAYPLDMITSEYRPYHTSSISYMLVFAYHSFLITGKPSRVEVYGAHMEAKEEYQDQRACCEYWMGCMEAVGIDVVPPADGVLLASTNGGLYGMENYNPICWDMRQRTYGLQNGIADAVSKIQAGETQKAKNEGALYECEFWLLKHQRGEYNGGTEHSKGRTEGGDENKESEEGSAD